MPALLAFDLDGTLVNTLPDITAAINHALQSLDLPPHTETAVRSMIGNGMRVLCSRALPPDRQDALESFITAYDGYYQQHICDLSAIYPGIQALLADAKQQGKKLCVLTNKPEAQTSRVLSALFAANTFDLILGQSPARPRKPAPDALFAALAHFRTDAEDCLYIGDSDVDIAFARAAKVPCVSVSWGYGDPQQLQTQNPGRVIHTAAALYPFAGIEKP